MRFSLLDADPGRLPFTINDHPLHYYYSQITADFFALRHSFWGYDPYFMAGYAKTMIFPTGCTLPELVAVVFGRGSVRAFRWFVASTIFLPPILLGLAARQIARSWGAFMLGFCLSVVWVWCGWPISYVMWGMAPFILSVATSVLAGSVLAAWLDEPSAKMLIAGGTLATIAVVAHPCSPVILALMLLPAYAARARDMNWRRHLTAWSLPATVILLWSPWWLPAWRLRDTFGSTETGFVNANIGGRLLELAQTWLGMDPRFREEAALLLAGAAAAVSLWGVGRARYCAVVGGAAAFFVFTYFGSAVEWVWKLQPGRYTQPLYAVLIVIVGAGWSRIASDLAKRPWRLRAVVTIAVSILCSVAGAGLVGPKVVAYLSHGPRPPFPTQLSPPVRELIDFLRVNIDSSGRVLFEDRGGADLGGFEPFQGTNPSALLPILAPGQYIGGPYLNTHLATNFTQFGDFKFFGRPVQTIDRETFDRYARLYNVRWLVAWSPPIQQLADRNPDQFLPRGQFGYLRVYELTRDPNWAIVGTASVMARPDRLEVRDAAPDEHGTLILSYHWVSTLRSSESLVPITLGDDPVPFIGVRNAPREFVIENRLW